MNIPRTYLYIRFMMGLMLTFALALARVTPASAAQRCYVKAGASGSGSSWANAYGNPQGALANAACTEIWVAKGIYKPTGGTDRTINFVLKNGVAIYGGFAGTETLLSQQNPALNPTILSGEIGSAVDKTDNSYHVVTGNAVNATAVLDGFQIKDGYAVTGFGGAGMLNSGNSSPTLRDLIFINNDAYVGGGMYNENSSPSLSRVTFIGNSALNGGGMYNFTNSSATLTDVAFITNEATGGGGGLFNSSSSPILMNVTFSGNQANNGAGMFSESGSSPSLKNVTFSGNLAASAGGGMYNYTGTSPTLMNVTLSGNSAPSGGGMVNDNSSTTVTNSILYGDLGGEISNISSTPSVTFSIVQGGWPGTGNLNLNPRLKPLGNYGGFTKTMPLGYGSPAIDHGTNAGCPLTDQRGVIRPQDGDLNGTATCDMGASESRLFLKPFPSIGSQDGWILESSETSGTGGSVHSTDTTLIVGDSINRQQSRGILSFNTASLPDTSQLVSAVLKVKQAGISLGNKNPFSTLGSLLVDVRKGPFSNNVALQKTDFEAQASKPAAMTILNNPTAAGWYSRAVPATSLPSINRAGLTQFRLRFSLDDNNDAVSNYIKFNSGNATTTSSRPVLIIKYYVP